MLHTLWILLAGDRPRAVDAPGCWGGGGPSQKRIRRRPWDPGQVRGGIIGVGVLFHDAATHRDDVPGKIGNKQDVACAEMVGPNKTVKIRAREGKDLAPCTDKVGRDWSLVLMLMGIEVDEAQRRQTDLGGDCEDDRGVIWDRLTAYLMGGGRR
jgi:hypothetical protein